MTRVGSRAQLDPRARLTTAVTAYNLRPPEARAGMHWWDRQGGSWMSIKSGPVHGRPIEVTVEGDNVDRALNRLKRKMADEGILKELKKRRFYEKPSVKKKRKQREAERRRRKEVKRRVARSRR